MKKFPSTENGFFSFADTTCEVVCECEGSLINPGLWVSDYEIVRCPNCGRGYKTEFVVWQFEPGEEGDSEHI